jgi:dolichyl-phosphate-mannose--protein O-mannosyl transferase
MPLGRQPRGARGTIERPYSALRLRLVLAIFGAVVCAIGAAILWHVSVVIAIILIVLGVIAIADLFVVATRLRR